MNTVVFPFDNTVPQYIPYPKPMMLYVLESAESCVLKKLHKTCKYFFIKRNVTTIDEFIVFNGIFDNFQFNISKNRLHLPLDKLSNLKNKIWLNDEFMCSVNSPLSQIFEKIVKCNIKLLNLNYCNLTENEFKKLTASGNVEEFDLFHSTVEYPDGKQYTIDDLFMLVPKAYKFSICPAFVSKNTSKNLLQLNHQVKISILCWVDIKQNMDAENINKFLMKTLNNQALIEIIFEGQEEIDDGFAQELHDKIKSWTPAERQPKYLHLNSINIPPPIEWP